MNNSPYKQKLKQNSRPIITAFVILAYAVICFIVVFLIVHRSGQKAKAPVIKAAFPPISEEYKDAPDSLDILDSAKRVEKLRDDFMKESASRRQRYFLVSYSTRETEGSGTVDGQRWFSTTGGFFQKTAFDSVIYASFQKKRNCYQHVIITNIFEFKSQSDFDSFLAGYKGDPRPKKQKGCCEPDTIQLSIRSAIAHRWKMLEGKRRAGL